MLTYTLDDIKETPYSKLSVFSYTNIMHSHTFYEIALVMEGTANSVINDGLPRQLHAGDLIIVRPHDSHSIQPQTKDYLHRDFYITEEKMRSIRALFSGPFFEEMMDQKAQNYYKFDIDDINLIEKKSAVFDRQTADLSEREKRQLNDMHTAIVIQIFGTIINRQIPVHGEIPQWLHNLYLHLSSFHYENSSIDQIVKSTGYSHSYVCRIFKKTYNITLQECLMRSKVILSASLLGKVKIIDIAASFGWENPKNYTIAFKKVYGVTPSQYRRTKRTGKGINITTMTPPPRMESLLDFEQIVEPQ